MGFGQRLGQAQASSAWGLSFSPAQRSSLYFGDYLAPYRQLLRSLRDSSTEEVHATFSGLTKGKLIFLSFCAIFNSFSGHSKRVLVSVSGRYSNYNTNQLIDQAIQHFTSSRPRSITTIPDSPWVIVEMQEKADIEKLILQKLILSLHRVPNRLILFRRIVKQSTRERVVEVKGLHHSLEIVEVKKILSEYGAIVTSEDPSEDEWAPGYSDRVVWKLRVQSSQWVVPTSVSLSRGHIQLVPAPNCDQCHSDDHHQSRCIWKESLYATL